MFTSTSDWVTGELEATTEEYRLLEQMNKLTLTKYSDMSQITENITKGVTDLNTKYTDLLPYLEQIDQIDASVERLEQAAYKLDAYSKDWNKNSRCWRRDQIEIQSKIKVHLIISIKKFPTIQLSVMFHTFTVCLTP